MVAPLGLYMWRYIRVWPRLFRGTAVSQKQYLYAVIRVYCSPSHVWVIARTAKEARDRVNEAFGYTTTTVRRDPTITGVVVGCNNPQWKRL
jgi:hypothetical protein